MTGKILLTGGSGMVGRNLLDLARERGVSIVAPRSSQLNLLDAVQTRAMLAEIQPDLIVHAAGHVGGIQANMREPVQFLTANWDMGRNLVTAAREMGVPRLINLGSSCMYPRNRQEALREEDVLTGELEPTNEGYAIAKIAVARLCDYVRRETPACQYKTLIPCNLYGAYDKFDPARSHLVPAVIHKLHCAVKNGQADVEIWGDGTARREFMHARDLADAILHAVVHFDSLPDYLNIGLGKDYSVNEYYRAAAEVIGFTGRFVHDTSKPVGMARKLTDVSRARDWGWQAETGLVEGLRLTYEHYLSIGVADVVSAG
ncbi:GDP-L-fucose synthase [Viridibacterium curvum]|uniref:GDP-L-fucose synthase n=1 Tax=Viridibacterium curvum TaxID=1101404 RepID=A0ABP9QLP8_9RHOO